MSKIYICADCGRADVQTKSWPVKCKLHAMHVNEECVILTKGKVGQKVKFYDPDPIRVQEYQSELDRKAEERRNKRG